MHELKLISHFPQQILSLLMWNCMILIKRSQLDKNLISVFMVAPLGAANAWKRLLVVVKLLCSQHEHLHIEGEEKQRH